MTTLTTKVTCEKCAVRLPKNRPQLVCSHCNKVKHYRCQNLSKAEAQSIVENTNYPWTCFDCLVFMLPVNARRNSKSSNNAQTAIKFKEQCRCCGGFSYCERNISMCQWCDQICHVKCLNGYLGCNTCCDSMIPGFRVQNYELYGDVNNKNNSIFNPYDRDRNVNVIAL